MYDMYISAASLVCYANDNDALVPEVWANEGLMLLNQTSVMAGLVHRDFSNEVANFGDVVNTRRPRAMRLTRKTDNDDVETQDAVVDNVRVPLDQHGVISFVIKDGEASKSMQELVAIHVVPAMQALGRGVDRGLAGMIHKYFSTSDKRAGRLLNLTTSNSKDNLFEAREIMNRNLAPLDGRNLVLGPASETQIVKTDLFLAADQRGDGGSAVENARLGRVIGFQTYLSQNVPSITTTNADIATGTVTNALAAGGSGSQAATITGYNVNVGEYAVVAGNDQPTHVTARTLNMADTTAVTLNEANKYATGGSAAITVYKKCDVKGAYDAGYAKEIVVDGWTATKAPQQGQLISFGTGGSRHTYTIIESRLSAVGEQSILLDRPLEFALADNDLAFPGPAGTYNFAFHRNALALVSRPVAAPRAGSGVMSAVASSDNLGMRVTMQYDSAKMGTRVNMDLLYGYAVLDTALAVAFLG